MSRHSASRTRPSRRHVPGRDVPAAAEDADLARARVGAVLLPALPRHEVPVAGSEGWTLPPPASVPAVEPPPAGPVPAAAPPTQDGVLAALRGGRLGLSAPGAVGLVGVALVCCLVAVLVAARDRPRPVEAPVVEQTGLVVPGPGAVAAEPSPAAVPAGVEVVVAVTGDVRRPGLVRLPPGSRVADALTAAGGVLPGTDVGGLNPARLLVDGEQVLVGAAALAAAAAVPPPGPQTAPGAPGAAPGAGAGPLDLNAATAADLDALPGIGPVLAERIVARREEHGPYRSVEQLREVEGIGPAKYESLRDLVRV